VPRLNNPVDLHECARRVSGPSAILSNRPTQPEMTKNLIYPTDSSRSGARKPTSQQQQQRNNAGPRDGTPGSQQNRRGGKASQTMTRPEETLSNAPSGPANRTPPAPRDQSPSSSTFNVDDIKKFLDSNMDASAETYKPSKSATKSAQPANPWAAKREFINLPPLYPGSSLTRTQLARWQTAKTSSTNSENR
jgi:hypothetical protein